MVRTVEQVQEILEQMREDGVPDEDLQVDDILLEEAGRLLVRRSTLTYLAGDYYFGVHYEIWVDRDMYQQGIYGEYLEDGDEVVYCYAQSGTNDEEMIKLFKQELRHGG